MGTPDRPRAVLLPGLRYPTHAPLLWFSREVALARGYEVVELREPPPRDGDPFAWLRERAARLLGERPSEGDVVIGKSLGSEAAGLVAERGLRAIWLTPLLDRESVLAGLAAAQRPALLVGGTADPTWRPQALPAERPQLTLLELDGLDHALQRPGDPLASLEALRAVTERIERFLAR